MKTVPASGSNRQIWSREWELNPRPVDYESTALPLSYLGPLFDNTIRAKFLSIERQKLRSTIARRDTSPSQFRPQSEGRETATRGCILRARLSGAGSKIQMRLR